MVTKAKIKFVKSLSERKNRAAAGLFVAEGAKAVEDMLASSLEVKEVFAAKDWLTGAASSISSTTHIEEVTEGELARLSDLTTAHAVVALVAIPAVRYDAAAFAKQLIIGLENVQDPGNLGAVIRLCDWFGIADILASQATVDCYNAKVVQATMGSIGRVRLHYRDDFLGSIRELKNRGKTVYATTLAGDNLYNAKLSRDAIVLFGNEGRGLSEELIDLCTQRLHIPKFNASIDSAESLNVAAAVAIVCSEFRRR